MKSDTSVILLMIPKIKTFISKNGPYISPFRTLKRKIMAAWRTLKFLRMVSKVGKVVKVHGTPTPLLMAVPFLGQSPIPIRLTTLRLLFRTISPSFVKLSPTSRRMSAPTCP